MPSMTCKSTRNYNGIFLSIFSHAGMDDSTEF